jgi:hypothetical protein
LTREKLGERAIEPAPNAGRRSYEYDALGL